MLTLQEYALQRNVTEQVIQIPRFFQPVGVIEKNPGSVPHLQVLVDNLFSLEDVTVYTFEIGDDMTAYSFIRTDMYVGTYLSPNKQDAQMVFL